MLHDPANKANTRALVTVDWPNDIAGNPAWSPDGAYLLYTLQTPVKNPDGSDGLVSNIWWLEIASGKTGKLTDDGVSLSPDWRPTCAGAGCGVPAGKAPGGGTGVKVPPGFGGVQAAPGGARKTYVPVAQRP